MTDLESRLRALRPAASGPADDLTVQADLRRARRALHRRRAVRLGTGTATALVVATLATVTLTGQHDAPAGDTASSAPPAAAGIRLVDYSGAQQPGFSVAKVPDGYVLQGATSYSLNIAPADDHTGLDVFEGKLVVMLQSQDVKLDTSGKRVRVHGTTGYVRTEEGTATTLEYVDGPHDVVIQAWANIGLTEQQLVDFANGVTVTAAAQASRG